MYPQLMQQLTLGVKSRAMRHSHLHKTFKLGNWGESRLTRLKTSRDLGRGQRRKRSFAYLQMAEHGAGEGPVKFTERSIKRHACCGWVSKLCA